MMMITIWIYCGNRKLLNLTPCCKFIQEKRMSWSIEVKAVQQGWQGCRACNLASVVRRVDNTIHWINLYLVDFTVCFITIICWIVTYPLESAPPLEQPGPVVPGSSPSQLNGLVLVCLHFNPLAALLTCTLYSQMVCILLIRIFKHHVNLKCLFPICFYWL